MRGGSFEGAGAARQFTPVWFAEYGLYLAPSHHPAWVPDVGIASPRVPAVDQLLYRPWFLEKLRGFL